MNHSHYDKWNYRACFLVDDRLVVSGARSRVITRAIISSKARFGKGLLIIPRDHIWNVARGVDGFQFIHVKVAILIDC